MHRHLCTLYSPMCAAMKNVMGVIYLHTGEALVNAFHGSQNVMNVLMNAVICMSFVMNGCSQGFSLLYYHMADD